MKLTTLREPLLEFGTGTHICPRTGIEHMGVYDKRDELRRTELRIGVVGRGEGIDLLDEWLEKCRNGIERKKDSKLLNLFRGFGGINQSYGFLTRLINSPQYTRTLKKSEISEVVKLASRAEQGGAGRRALLRTNPLPRREQIRGRHCLRRAERDVRFDHDVG